MRPTEFPVADAGAGSVAKFPVELGAAKTKYLQFQEVKSERPELTEASVVVSGGRGTKGDFKPIEALAEHGVPADRIRFELFTTDRELLDGDAGRPVVVRPDEETYRIEFTLDGLSSSVESPVRAQESILNAALRVRADVPFACAGGVCGTCRARLIEGRVQMTENYALEPDELERGYVLTCQSHPATPAVKVDYDV